MRLASLKEGATLAVDQLRSNKFRSALTILGIVVGVATVMAMSALIAGVRTAILSEVTAVGPRNFYVSRYDPTDVEIVDGPSRRSFHPPITVAEANAIARLPTIEKTLIGFYHSGQFTWGRQRLGSGIDARGIGWLDFENSRIISGSDITATDVQTAAPVVLLSLDLAEALFGPIDPIGRRVRISGVPFDVIGVYQRENVFEEGQDNRAVAPYSSVIKHLNASARGLNIFVTPEADVDQAVAMDQVITLLRTSRRLTPKDENTFALTRPEQMIATFNRLTAVFFLIMISLSSVGLMVGGVGVIAIMMIAVSERTREIGIRKALGATRREILWQFLFESTTVTFIGAAVGMLAGGGLAAIVERLTPVPAAVPVGAVVAALAMAVVAGILFGIWPAWRAARMDPVEALRYE